MSALVKKNWSNTAGCYVVIVDGNPVRAWYDRRLRLWTIQRVDGNGNQIGHCYYTPVRADVEHELGGAA